MKHAPVAVLVIVAVFALVCRWACVQGDLEAQDALSRVQELEESRPMQAQLANEPEGVAVRAEVEVEHEGIVSEEMASEDDDLAQSGKGVVTVRLVTAVLGAFVNQGAVSAVEKGHSKPAAKMKVDAHGEVHFELAEGTYSFTVEGTSLPMGMQPPPLQGRAHSYQRFPEFYAPVVEVTEGSSDQVELLIHRPGRIHGRITDAEGQPTSIEVRISSITRSKPRLHPSTMANSNGEYELFLMAGDYRVRLEFMSKEHPLYGTTKPLPVDFTIHPGEDLRIDLAFGAGSCSIRGVLMDPALLASEEDLYYSNKRVFIFPLLREDEQVPGLVGHDLGSTVAIVRTNERGAFEATGLEPGLYKLSFEPYDGWDREERNCSFAEWVPQAIVDLTEAESHDIGNWQARRARPCDVFGTVVLSEPIPYDKLVMSVTYPRGFSGKQRYSKQVPIRPDGTFEFFVHTSLDNTPAIVRLGRTDKLASTITRKVQVPPSGSVGLQLNFP